MNNIKTTIIVPAYNEEEGLPIVLEKIFRITDDSYEVLVIDDGSSDGTSEVAATFPCRVIGHEVNKGKGQALKTGIANARGEIVIWIDADDTYPAELIPKIIKAFQTDDVVVCSRQFGRENIPKFNRIGNWLFRTMIRGIYGFKGFDPCTGLYAARKKDLEAMDLTADRFAIEPEISIKAGRMKLRTLDMPIEYRNRIGGTKLNAIKVGFEDLLMILSLIGWVPSRGKKPAVFKDAGGA